MNATPAYRVLVLEDDAALRAVLRDFLSLMHYQVLEAADLASFRALSTTEKFDLLLLDLNLPDGDGLALLKELAAAGDTAVFVVSGRCDEHSRLEALEAGADDYIVKPFNARELEFRIRNFLRRQNSRRAAGATQATSSLSFGEWHLQPSQYRVTGPQGAMVSLTRSERDLLRELIQAKGSLCNRRQLARAMSSPMETTSEETVTVLIYRLRKKLEAAGVPGPLIETVAGAGYRFVGMDT
ncbi:response regulator transcription factor [Alcanivorax sp. 1008]|uniref:response regulator transcription factor n=1 Tax=Alcanivorax sp. 1008 TaxID=2816853 RepID=UPI001DB7EE54|nr:response regulator transcription factor [Alcanivorax sp. 1008]MCC1496385.1 response regulator transcription factor [Alcanivorax sp. 1008]